MAIPRLISVVLSLAYTSHAADCSTDQPRREGGPPRTRITKAIEIETELQAICSTKWRVGDEQRLDIVCNRWSAYEIKASQA
jgi:hypothetical protein